MLLSHIVRTPLSEGHSVTEAYRRSSNQGKRRAPARFRRPSAHPVGAPKFEDGPVANAKERVAIQIRDLDQTVIGNPAHDLIRLVLSQATAARGSDLPGVTTAQMIEQMVEAIEQAIGADDDENQTDRPRVVQHRRTRRRPRGRLSRPLSALCDGRGGVMRAAPAN
jgi:hypothetical protein